jgi:hypothetical protein
MARERGFPNNFCVSAKWRSAPAAASATGAGILTPFTDGQGLLR